MALTKAKDLKMQSRRAHKQLKSSKISELTEILGLTGQG
jgi:hypothetical protein